MNENTMTEAYAAHKKNIGELPKPLCVSIHPVANKGSLKDGEYVNSAFQIHVKGLNPKTGKEEWHPESEWYIILGMKTTRRIYTTFAKADAAKAEIKETWGVVKAKKERKSRKDDEIAALTEMVIALRAELAKKAA